MPNTSTIWICVDKKAQLCVEESLLFILSRLHQWIPQYNIHIASLYSRNLGHSGKRIGFFDARGTLFLNFAFVIILE